MFRSKYVLTFAVVSILGSTLEQSAICSFGKGTLHVANGNKCKSVGVSSDDSNEVDINHAFFTVEPVATDGAGEDVNVKLAFDGSDNKIYVVFDKFEDEVHLDPTAGVDTKDSANAVSVAASLLFTLLAAAFA